MSLVIQTVRYCHTIDRVYGSLDIYIDSFLAYTSIVSWRIRLSFCPRSKPLEVGNGGPEGIYIDSFLAYTSILGVYALASVLGANPLRSEMEVRKAYTSIVSWRIRRFLAYTP